jgi:hypothetical protein
MPLLILGVGVAEPLIACRAVHCGGIRARLIVRGHALTQAHQVPLSVFFPSIGTPLTEFRLAGQEMFFIPFL